MKIRELGKKLKNGNVPLISNGIKNIQHLINEPYETYWNYVNQKARRKSSDERIFRMLNNSYKDIIYSDDWEKKLAEFEVSTVPKKRMEDDRIPVFTMWLQGFENAPDIVKICNNSVERWFDQTRYNVIKLDANNVFEYIELPPVLKNMWNNFGDSHKSDIVRLILLYQYGGIWIDATYYIVREIPKLLLSNELFVFKYSYETTHNKNPFNFIFCRVHDEIIGRTLLGMLSYCQKNKKFKYYLMINYIFSFATDANTRTKEEYNSIPFRLSEPNFLLRKELNSQFKKSEWEYMNNLTFCFKLTHKKQLSEKPGTYYNFIKNCFRKESVYGEKN